MKIDKNTTVLDCFVYGIVMLFSNLAGTLVMLLLMIILKYTIGQEGVLKIYAVILFVCTFVSIAAAVFLTRLYFRYKISDIVPKPGENYDAKRIIVRNYLFMVLPAEILRMILSILPLPPGNMFGYRFFDGVFAIAPNFICDQLYMMPNSRIGNIRESGYTFTDNAVFFVIYLMYFLICITVLYFAFRDVWNKYEDERKNEVRITMDPEQMK